eukprot:CAMPEP_0194379722 /NCGR_PEP_ID=MMETSP0174-20130528/40242_1 /TAXON_ID=216777 /ORGANISM="Proboscia alata, Strain PI-D3" /LENGTH=371 /DNA_ID=CAMNT_0039162595 /DNA_START=241 /DNA_END=1353 /DNA_ORIENTATION=+
MGKSGGIHNDDAKWRSPPSRTRYTNRNRKQLNGKVTQLTTVPFSSVASTTIHHVDASNMDSVCSDEYEREEERAVLAREEEVILAARIQAMKTLRKSTVVLDGSQRLRSANEVNDHEMVQIYSNFESSLVQGNTSSLDRGTIEFALDEYLFRTEDVESDDIKSSAILGTMRYKVANFCCKTRRLKVSWNYVCLCIPLAVLGSILFVVFSHGSNKTNASVSETSSDNATVFTSNATPVPSYLRSSNTPSAQIVPPQINAASNPTVPPSTNPASRPTAPPTTNPISPTTVSLEDYNYYLTDVPSSAYIPPNTPSSKPSLVTSNVAFVTSSDTPSLTPTYSPSNVPSAIPSSKPSQVPFYSPSNVTSLTPGSEP